MAARLAMRHAVRTRQRNDSADYVTLKVLAAMPTSRCPSSCERSVAFLARVMEARRGNFHGLQGVAGAYSHAAAVPAWTVARLSNLHRTRRASLAEEMMRRPVSAVGRKHALDVWAESRLGNLPCGVCGVHSVQRIAFAVLPGKCADTPVRSRRRALSTGFFAHAGDRSSSEAVLPMRAALIPSGGLSASPGRNPLGQRCLRTVPDLPQAQRSEPRRVQSEVHFIPRPPEGASCRCRAEQAAAASWKFRCALILRRTHTMPTLFGWQAVRPLLRERTAAPGHPLRALRLAKPS